MKKSILIIAITIACVTQLSARSSQPIRDDKIVTIDYYPNDEREPIIIDQYCHSRETQRHFKWLWRFFRYLRP